MDIPVEVELQEVENEHGFEQPGVKVTCTRCGHSQEAFGTGDKSIRRACVKLRESCPQSERNFYVDEDGAQQVAEDLDPNYELPF